MSDEPRPAPVDPEHGPPDRRAAELVVDGLLRSFGAPREAAEARIARVVEALRAPAASPVFHARGRRRPRLVQRTLRAFAALALVAALALLVSRTGLPGEGSALAQVRGAISSMRAPGDRRYEIRVITSEGAEVNAVPDTIDARYPQGLMLIRHHPPHYQTDVFVGRDDQGMWSIGRSGAVNRESPRRDLPPWASVDGQWILDDTVDRLLEGLTRSYTLKSAASEAIPGLAAGRPLYRISAARTAGGSARFDPGHVEIWIDPDTRIVERVELRWDPSIAGTPGRAGERQRRPGPPLAVIFQHVEAGPFPNDWFSAAAHAR